MAATNGADAADHVVIEQTLLRIDECFVYRIPPMKSADGHRAEDWNLAKPLATCSLAVVRHDDDLRVDVNAERPKPNAPAGAMESYLFAQSRIRVDLDNPAHRIEHWVNPVVDSSRYFALRIRDSRSGREAFVGVGFRERTDATNFRMSVEDYIESLRREAMAAALHDEFEKSLSACSIGEKGVDDGSDEARRKERLPLPKSSLSLKEGEMMHIVIKGKGGDGAGRKPKSPKAKKGTITGLVGLKKPPPPPDAMPAPPPEPEETNKEESKVADNGGAEEDVDWGDFEG